MQNNLFKGHLLYLLIIGMIHYILIITYHLTIIIHYGKGVYELLIPLLMFFALEKYKIELKEEKAKIQLV